MSRIPKAVIAAVLRIAASIFFLPAFGAIGAACHGLLSMAHVAASLIAKARGVDLQEVRGDMTKGIHHLVLAIYNLAVGLLCVPLAIGFAAHPEKLIELHNTFYNGWEEQQPPVIFHNAASRDWAERCGLWLFPEPAARRFHN